MTMDERVERLERELARVTEFLLKLQEHQIEANDALIETREWVLAMKTSAAAG